MYQITGYDAVSDGTTLRISAISHAADAWAGAGGAIHPVGTFVSGAIFGRNNTIAFHRNAGAIQSGSRNCADYPTTDSHAFRFRAPASLLTGHRRESMTPLSCDTVHCAAYRLAYEHRWPRRDENTLLRD